MLGKIVVFSAQIMISYTTFFPSSLQGFDYRYSACPDYRQDLASVRSTCPR
jgi:hypothetical protein